MTCVRLRLDHEWIKSRVWVEKNMDFLSPLEIRRWIMPLVGHCCPKGLYTAKNCAVPEACLYAGVPETELPVWWH